MLNIEDSFAKLQFEANQKLAEIKSLETQRQASQQRLDDNLRREAEAQVALQKVSATLDQASKQLTQAKRDATKIISDARADADRIRQQSRDEAQGFLQGVRSAVAAAATMIKSKHKPEE